MAEVSILLFGGTTEGRKAIAVLEESGSRFYYSTKTGEQDVTLQHGIRIDGAMDGNAMLHFCQEKSVHLLIDAAHPFAQQLHQTVASVAETLAIPAIRFERIFPPRDSSISWCDDYAHLRKLCREMLPTKGRPYHLLATTGVQSIAQLKPLEEEGIQLFYRILPRESSVALAKKQGARDEQLCYYSDGSTIDVEADAILLKESGQSGGFVEKVAAARAKGMHIFALKRPATPAIFHQVNGPHGLRRMVEQLLPDFFPLKSGLTTGTCATAASIAATIRLLHGQRPAEVPVVLPNGETIPVPVGYGDGYAYCIKQAGDDPDVTDGLEIRATVAATDFHGNSMATDSHGLLQASTPDNTVRQSPPKSVAEGVQESPSKSVAILGGEGVGRFTLPGFDFPPGEPAINKAPRQMIRQNLAPFKTPLSVTISVPDGEAVARRTFNPRLGIEGGISIIGVSGIVMPFSEEAFIESIHKCMEVAKASGTDRVVINSGAKSERFVRARYPALPAQAFVEYGNYIGETLKMARKLRFPHVTLGVMLGKAVKLAAGQLDTHSRKSTMDKIFTAQMLHEAGYALDISAITLARELWELLPEEQRPVFAHVVIAHCLEHCQPLLSQEEQSLTILLIDDEGHIYSAP